MEISSVSHCIFQTCLKLHILWSGIKVSLKWYFHCSLWRRTTWLYRRWRRWLKAYTRLGCVSLPLIILWVNFCPSQKFSFNVHTLTHTQPPPTSLYLPYFQTFRSTLNKHKEKLAPKIWGLCTWYSKQRSSSVMEGWAVQCWGVGGGGLGKIHHKVFLRWPHPAHVGSGVYEWGPLLWDQPLWEAGWLCLYPYCVQVFSWCILK